MQMATLLPLPASLLALAKVMLAQRVNTAAQAARAGFQFSSACCMPSPAQQLTWQQTMQLPNAGPACSAAQCNACGSGCEPHQVAAIAAVTTCMMQQPRSCCGPWLFSAGGWQQLQHRRCCCGGRATAGQLRRACAAAPYTPPLVLRQGMQRTSHMPPQRQSCRTTPIKQACGYASPLMMHAFISMAPVLGWHMFDGMAEAAGAPCLGSCCR